MPKTTYFGLEIVNTRGVRLTDIACLPFNAFWKESAVGSGMVQDADTDDWLIHLHDWKAFSLLFIATGRHRHMARTPYVAPFDRDEDEPDHTFFGLEIYDQRFVCKEGIALLPFHVFWQEYDRAPKMLPALKDPALVHLDDWKNFAKRFIETGRHCAMPEASST